MQRMLILGVISAALCASASGVWAQEATAEQEAAPGLVLRDMQGSEQALDGLRGKIVVLNFWATWCVPCIEEMPLLEQIYKDYAARGVVVVGASADEPATQKNIAGFVEKLRLTFPIWTGATTDDMERFGLLPALPATAILDRDGRIVARIMGPLVRDDIVTRLDWLLGPRTSPAPVALVNHFEKLAAGHEGHDHTKDPHKDEHAKEEEHSHGNVGMEGASTVPS